MDIETTNQIPKTRYLTRKPAASRKLLDKFMAEEVKLAKIVKTPENEPIKRLYNRIYSLVWNNPEDYPVRVRLRGEKIFLERTDMDYS